MLETLFSLFAKKKSADAHGDKKESASLLSFILIVLAIVLPIRYFVAKPFIVSGTSMYPNFDSWHYLIVDEFTYIFVREPQRGEVIVMKYPLDTSRYFIKRVIGLPGETVKISGSTVTIVNAEHPEGFTLEEGYVAPENMTQNEMSFTLQPTDYFVMGDNRRASADSRYWGPLPRVDIVGRAFVRLFPFTQIELFPASLEKFTGVNY
jgi:signal peptidase I